jgi:hypothetical protein
MPLFLVLLLVAIVAVKYGALKPGAIVLGVLLGLTMASTSLGPPIRQGLNQFSETLVSTLSQATGGAQ